MSVLALTTGQTTLVAVIIGTALLLNGWALIDLLRRPTWAFEHANVNRILWILLLALSWTIGIGFVIAIWYLLMVSPKVRNQQQLGAGPGFPGRR